MNPIIELYRVSLHTLAAMHQSEAAVDATNGEIVLIKAGESLDVQIVRLDNVGKPSQVEFDHRKDKFITLADFAQNNAKVRRFCAKSTQIMLKSYAQFSQQATQAHTQFKQDVHSSDTGHAPIFSSDNAKVRLIGKGKIDRPAVSEAYTGELQKLMRSIEKLTDKIVKNTNFDKTIKRAGETYDKAVKIAEGSHPAKINQLREIMAALQTSSDRQDRRHAQNMHEANLRSPLRKAKIVIGTSAILLILFFAVWNVFFRSNGRQSGIRALGSQAAVFYSTQEINSLIDSYERKKNTKIYTWRRDKIINAFPNQKLTNRQASAIIKREAERKYGGK